MPSHNSAAGASARLPLPLDQIHFAHRLGEDGVDVLRHFGAALGKRAVPRLRQREALVAAHLQCAESVGRVECECKLKSLGEALRAGKRQVDR